MARVEVKFVLEYTRYLDDPTEEDIAEEIHDIRYEMTHYKTDPQITVTNLDTGEEIPGW